jgi:glycosyltransferase involved in cell wall biosynthesis
MSERSDARAPFSVLVPVKNEAANLRDCLASVSFAQEIVVIDSGSTDGTQAIAEAAGARVIQFAWNGKLPRKKNWALENVPWQHQWVLIIDADERITPELEREIRQAICRTDVDGFYLNRRFWFLDGWINHCGYFPSATFIEKHDRYSSWEASAWRKLHSVDEKSLRSTPFGTGLERKRWVKKATMRAPFRPSLRFVYHYFWSKDSATAIGAGYSAAC